MSASNLLKPATVQTNRSELRQKQASVLRHSRGRTVVVVEARAQEGEKYVVDRRYFDELLGKLRDAIQALEIVSDTKFYNQLLRASQSMDADIRLGRLHSFEEALGEHAVSGSRFQKMTKRAPAAG